MEAEGAAQLREIATEQVMKKEWTGELADTVTSCLLKRDNETLQSLLQKMTRMVRNRADQLSRGLSESEVSCLVLYIKSIPMLDSRRLHRLKRRAATCSRRKLMKKLKGSKLKTAHRMERRIRQRPRHCIMILVGTH